MRRIPFELSAAGWHGLGRLVSSYRAAGTDVPGLACTLK